MDPFTEKQLIDNLSLISGTLMGIKAELADLNVAVREMNEIALDSNFSEDNNVDEEDEGEGKLKSQEEPIDHEEKIDIGEADEGFVVSEEDTIVGADNPKLVPEDADEEKEENAGDSF